MEVHINEKKILEDASGGYYLSEIYSQVARETPSEKAATRGYHYSQVFLSRLVFLPVLFHFVFDVSRHCTLCFVVYFILR